MLANDWMIQSVGGSVKLSGFSQLDLKSMTPLKVVFSGVKEYDDNGVAAPVYHGEYLLHDQRHFEFFNIIARKRYTLSLFTKSSS